MADILDLIPGLSNLSGILGGSNQDRNMFRDPAADRLNIAGVPIAPILAGLATGAIARSFAPRHQRGAAMGSGFGLGHQLFNQPIEEARRRNDAIFQKAIDKGWLTPFGASTAAGKAAGIRAADPAATSATSATVPLTTSPSDVPTDVPTPAVNIGGMPLFMAPTMKATDLFPGRKLPPALAGIPVVLPSDPTKLADIQGIIETNQQLGKTDDYVQGQIAKYGLDPNLSRQLALSEIGLARAPELIGKYREAVKPYIDENTGVSFDVGPDGRPQLKLFAAPSALTGMQRTRLEGAIAGQASEAELRKMQQEAMREERGLRAEEAKSRAEVNKLQLQTENLRLDHLKGKTAAATDPNSPQGKRFRLNAAQAEMTGLISALGKTQEGRSLTTPPTPQELANERSLHKRIFEISNEMRELASGGETTQTPPTGPILTPEQEQQATKAAGYLDTFKSLPDWGKIDSLPAPRNPLEREAFNTARGELKTRIDEMVAEMNQGAERGILGGYSIPKETEAYLRARFGNDYDRVFNLWKRLPKSNLPES